MEMAHLVTKAKTPVAISGMALLLVNVKPVKMIAGTVMMMYQNEGNERNPASKHSKRDMKLVTQLLIFLVNPLVNLTFTSFTMMITLSLHHHLNHANLSLL